MNEAKLGDELLPRYQSMPASEQTGVIVKYRPAPAPAVGAAAARIADEHGVEVDHHYTLIPAVAGRATKGQIESLSDDPTIEKIWWDAPVHVMLDVAVQRDAVPEGARRAEAVGPGVRRQGHPHLYCGHGH